MRRVATMGMRMQVTEHNGSGGHDLMQLSSRFGGSDNDMRRVLQYIL